MASSPPTPMQLALAAAAILILTATPASARGRSLIEIRSDDVCHTSSFPEVCMAMMGTADYKSDAELTLAMLTQAQAKAAEAMAVAAGAGGTVGQTCKASYEKAARDLAESVKYFHLTPEIALAQHMKSSTDMLELWHRYSLHLMTAAADAYQCTCAVQESKEPVAPALRELSDNLLRFLYTAYDLCTRTQDGV